MNKFGNENGHNCASNEANYASHIWDRRDAQGRMGATACIVVPWFSDRYEAGEDWRATAWWLHDHLPYSSLYFFPTRAAFNITWREEPERRIDSYVVPKGCLTRPGMAGHEGDHSALYPGFPALVTTVRTVLRKSWAMRPAKAATMSTTSRRSSSKLIAIATTPVEEVGGRPSPQTQPGRHRAVIAKPLALKRSSPRTPLKSEAARRSRTTKSMKSR